MEEHENMESRPMPQYGGYVPPPRYVFPMGKRELLLSGGVLLSALLLAGSLFYHGAQLGFSLGAAGLLVCSLAYLKKAGHRPGGYAAALLGLSLLIIGSFPFSDDGVLKFLAICALLAVPGLAFSVMAGKHKRDTNGFASVFEGLRTLFSYGFGQMGAAGRGIRQGVRECGRAGKTGGAVALGLLLAVPVVAVLIPLLVSADAAFEGMLKLLPEFRWQKTVVTAVSGTFLAYIFYTRTAALHYLPKAAAPEKVRKGLHALTVNTVLVAAAVVYLAYLVSQLAYFVGGFAGILPKGYTLAEYARRGFFEMGWLCAINLLLIACAVALVTARGSVPLATRLLCLFVGLVTLFLVAAASAKMFLYIESYGLTRLRVLTEVFMVWLVLTTVFVCVWLFRPKAGYMKQAVVLALALGAVLLWCDVDAFVARYNVRAYQNGRLETVDMTHLDGLSAGAVPYIAELTEDADAGIARRAVTILESKARRFDRDTDPRGWNLRKERAWVILERYRAEDSAPGAEAAGIDLMRTISRTTGISGIDGVVVEAGGTHGGFHGDGETVAKLILTEDAVEKLEAETVSAPGWHSLPAPESIRALCRLFTDENGSQFAPNVQKGLYYFYDRHSQSENPYDEEAASDRASWNFTLVIYDQQTRMLYFMELDT